MVFLVVMMFLGGNFDFVVLWLGDDMGCVLLNFDIVWSLNWNFHGIRNFFLDLHGDFLNNWVGLGVWDL